VEQELGDVVAVTRVRIGVIAPPGASSGAPSNGGIWPLLDIAPLCDHGAEAAVAMWRRRPDTDPSLTFGVRPSPHVADVVMADGDIPAATCGEAGPLGLQVASRCRNRTRRSVVEGV